MRYAARAAPVSKGPGQCPGLGLFSFNPRANGDRVIYKNIRRRWLRVRFRIGRAGGVRGDAGWPLPPVPIGGFALAIFVVSREKTVSGMRQGKIADLRPDEKKRQNRKKLRDTLAGIN